MQEQQQQQQQAQGAPADHQGDRVDATRRTGDDDTWGLGSATALDSLRRRNFRGRRSPLHAERPTSE